MATISTQVVPTITQAEQQDNVIPVYQVSREEMDNQLKVIRETARQNDTSELEEYTRFVVGELSARYPNLLDYDSLKDDSVTIRNRDSMKQERIPIKNLETHITKFTSINNLLRKI